MQIEEILRSDANSEIDEINDRVVMQSDQSKGDVSETEIQMKQLQTKKGVAKVYPDSKFIKSRRD